MAEHMGLEWRRNTLNVARRYLKEQLPYPHLDFLVPALESAEADLAAREADVRVLATALRDCATSRSEEELSAVLAEVLPYYREWVPKEES